MFGSHYFGGRYFGGRYFGGGGVPASAIICMAFYHQSGTGAVQTGGSSIENDVSLSVSSGFPGTDSYPVVGQGTFIASADGTVQLRLRSEVADVVTAKAGMILIVERVA